MLFGGLIKMNTFQNIALVTALAFASAFSGCRDLSTDKVEEHAERAGWTGVSVNLYDLTSTECNAGKYLITGINPEGDFESTSACCEKKDGEYEVCAIQ